ncbi:hypothetical protein VTH06DRAFT_7902 [Thermothelomyces fergusii]
MAEHQGAPISAEALSGQVLHIPDLRPAFASWKHGVNPNYEWAKTVVEERLEDLVENREALAKLKAADPALYAAYSFPTVSAEDLKTVAFYSVWLFLWDDVIERAADAPAAEAYCRRSVAFARRALEVDGPETAPCPEEEEEEEEEEEKKSTPARIRESFGDVGRRLVERGCPAEQRRALFERLREYMEGCVVEYKWLWSGRLPSPEQFYSWRLKTSAADVTLEFYRIINDIDLPTDVLGSEEHAAVRRSANKLMIIINELFSLRKELRDGAFGNLVPITMRALGTDLEGATQALVQDIHSSIKDFDDNASALRSRIAPEHDAGVAEQLRRLTESYQGYATAVLNFSIQSPRYGLSKYRQEDGSYAVPL